MDRREALGDVRVIRLVAVAISMSCGLATAAAAQSAAVGDARASLQDGTLVLETARIRRTLAWNDGAAVGRALEDRATGRRWTLAGTQPDVVVPGGGALARGTLQLTPVAATPLRPAHLRVAMEAHAGALRVRRTCELFPGSPAIGCTVALRGPAGWEVPAPATAGRGLIESDAPATPTPEFTLDRLALPSPHWRLEIARFRTATDHHDNLVEHDHSLLYRREQQLEGGLLRLQDQTDGAQIFVLKEAPPGNDQLGYPGFDFAAKTGDVRVAGSGVESGDVGPDAWTSTYAVAVGVAAPGERAFLEALRAHQDTKRRYVPSRDAMLLSNTWGDRGRDARINEAFVLREIEAAHRLGLTHVQLDDGWQAGLSRNSAQKGGQLWADWTEASWRPHPERFPRGLQPVVNRARALGLEVGLWFNPSSADDYAAWRRDADVLIALYRAHGVRVFKIDGVEVPSKRAETNLRAFFDRVMEATGGEVVFNADVTAGRRPGYFFLREYGNLFLENRYTDWGNYYPHRTLRNLWQLARYVPPQFLQVEFLNTARNVDKYPPGDRLAPSAVPFAYAFGVTAAAQPLAWMEVANLPEAARRAAPLIARYRALQPRLHAGRVFPIGAEPDGGAWTGFQSLEAEGRSGYLIVYREPLAASARGVLPTLLTRGVRTRFEPVLGGGEAFEAVPGPGGEITVYLPQRASFAIYRYVQR